MSMIASRRISSSTSRRYVKTIQTAVSPSTPAWQHARYLATSNRSIPQHLTAQSQLSLSSSFLQPSFTASGLTSTISPNPQPHRSLHTSHTLRQQSAQRKPDPSTASEPNPSEASPKESSSESKSDEPKTSEKGQTEGEGEAEAEGDQKKDKKDAAPPPPHGDKTPWQVFRETWSSELKASQEWNDSTKQLAGEVQDFRDSEAVKKASVAYDKTFGAAGRGAHTAAKAVGTGATIAWETPVVQGVRKGVNATGRGIERATRPVRESEAFKKISEAIDDGSSSRYGGWVEKEERRARRAAREAKNPSLKVENHEEDPNAGTNITLHKDAAWKEAWNNFKDSSKLGDTMRTWRSTYEESENPLISTARSITDRIAGFFAENETAMVIKKLREMDPNFQMEPFLQDMREFALLEVLDAYVKGDVETLKLWLSAAQFQVYSALMEQYTKHGLKSDGKIVDIRGVEVLNARLLEPGEIPVLILTARTQEIHCYRNKKTNELAAGTEDKIQQVTYAIGVTRLPEEVNNPETRGWRVIELQKAARDYI